MDWSNGRQEWPQSKPMNCDKMLFEQIKGIKEASGNKTKVFTYRNIVKALPWFEMVREKITDPQYMQRLGSQVQRRNPARPVHQPTVPTQTRLLRVFPRRTQLSTRRREREQARRSNGLVQRDM